jgi:hypothetical protein
MENDNGFFLAKRIAQQQRRKGRLNNETHEIGIQRKGAEERLNFHHEIQ